MNNYYKYNLKNDWINFKDWLKVMKEWIEIKKNVNENR